jgi:hypothetical protein
MQDLRVWRYWKLAGYLAQFPAVLTLGDGLLVKFYLAMAALNRSKTEQ